MTTAVKKEGKRTVYARLSKVQAELSKTGISKEDVNKFDKYKYRGIDSVLNALAPLLAKNGLVIMPEVVDKTHSTVTTKQGGTANYWVLTVNYHFIDVDGDSHTVTAYGEAIDRSDKAINQAMTAAYKYMLFQAFTIPVIGQDSGDSDSETHEIDVAPADPAALDELKGLLAQTGVDAIKMSSWLGAPSIDQLNAEQIATGTISLRTRLDAMNARKNNPQENAQQEII